MRAPSAFIRPGVPIGSVPISGAIPVPTVVQDMRTSATDPNPTLVTIAPNASAHVKTGWTELIATTTADADQIVVALGLASGSRSAATSAIMFDLGIGASGSEVVVAENVALGGMGLDGTFTNNGFVVAARSITLPISIPRGSRIAVRYQLDWASTLNINFAATLLRFPPQFGIRSPSKLDTFGANTATTSGVAMSTTSNVAVEMIASTARAYQGFVVCYFNNDGTMGNSTNSTAIDVGVGASGSEQFVVDGGVYHETGFEQIRHGMLSTRPILAPIHCPAGSRVAARYRTLNPATTAARVVLLGVPYA